MQILYLSGDVNTSMTENFIKEFNKIPIKDNITIYLYSDGGDVGNSDVIIDIINRNKERIKLIAVSWIFSAAFNIFFFTECEKEIVEDTVGMVHFSWATFDIDEAGRPKSEMDKFLMEDRRRNKLKTLRRLSNIGLNTKEITRVRKGEEVYLTTKRLNQLLKWQKS